MALASRRDWLKYAAIGCGAGSMSGWLDRLAAQAAEHPQRNKSIIVLWLDGGPATIDLWDLKPGHENGGPFQEIETASPGLRISEHLPKLAKQGQQLSIVRSMTSKEGDHGRATRFVKTGYLPQGAIQFPAVGAVVAHRLHSETSDLPGFVSIGPSRDLDQLGGGFLGPRYSPLAIGADDDRNSAVLAASEDDLNVPNLMRPAEVTAAAQRSRLELLAHLEGRFSQDRHSDVIDGLQVARWRAVQLMQPAAASAFDLHQESESVRESYGPSFFGQGCLLARRLVERQVPFVEVTLGGWDTHQNNFEQVKSLSSVLDTGFSALIADLQSRGLLDSTLILCLGEFGRTPKINGNTGRDHWPGSWSVALAGGGLRHGQAIGSTDEGGMKVADRPVTVPDLIATACSAVGIDPRQQNMSNVARPIRVADPSAEPIKELLG